MAVFGISAKKNEQSVSPANIAASVPANLLKEVHLTQKQLDALHTALNNNYYSWPRKVTLEDMANRSNTTRRAFQENLRKAEAKLLPLIVRKFIRGE